MSNIDNDTRYAKKMRVEECIKFVKNPNDIEKDPDEWRFVVGNIGTIPSPTTTQGLWKIDVWRSIVLSCDVNVITEINKDMGKVKDIDKIEEIIKGWWKGATVRSEYLIEDEYSYRDWRQQGGLAMIMNGMITTHIIEQGGDKRRLGRWRWIVCRGKQNTKTCIIGCYKPGSTWVTALNQAVAINKKRKKGEESYDPLTIWIEDMEELIMNKQNEGCEIIVTGDFNEDLKDRKGPFVSMANKIGLREVLIEKYPCGKDFSTYERGSTIIDGVFMSQNLQIERGGYVSFDDSPSDHRWLWFDIKINYIVGEAFSMRARPLERKATSKVPSIRENFNKILNEQVRIHKLDDKVKKLTEDIKVQMLLGVGITMDLKQQMDLLNEILIRTVQTADNQCQKARRGHVPSAPLVDQSRGIIRILRLVIRRWNEKGKKSRPNLTRIKRLAKKYKYTGPLSFSSLEDIRDVYKKAIHRYQSLRPYAQQYRETYLGRIAEERSQRDGKDIDLHFKVLMDQEDMRRQFQRIKAAECRANRKGVNMVEREEQGVRIRITDKESIEWEISEANKAKLLQAYNTPLRMEPLQSLLGEQMEYEKWEEILRGNVSLPEEGIEEGTRLWYEYISSQQLRDFIITWTPEEYFESWKKMKEDKSSAPGIHMGHLKCIDPCSPAGYVVSMLALLPLQTGYAPTRWRTGIDSMILKKTSDMRPEKLRLILLMDARFNHNNKLIGKMILEYGEKYKILAEEQYGSRKNKSSIQHVFNKRCILDHIRQFRKKAIYCANDARSCYDRILLIVAYLTLRIHGIPREAAQCSVDTICRMKHYIRTVYGDSNTFYGGDTWLDNNGQYPHGNGQGNGNGPSLWSCISSPLLHILRDQNFGIALDSPISKEKLDLSAIGYVDDMDYIQMEPRNQAMDIENLIQYTQDGLSMWDSLLRTTGGSLEIDDTKTDYVGIDFVQKSGIMIMTEASSLCSLRARDTSGVQQQLKRIKVTDSRKTLGVYQSPTGHENKQYEYMLEVVRRWTSAVRMSFLSKADTMKAAIATIGRTLEYPLSATSLSEQQCHRIMSAFLQTALPKMGYARTTSRSLVFAPSSMMGCGIGNLFVQQVIAHATVLLDHGHCDSLTGKLIRIATESLSIESGWGGDPFQIDFDQVTWTMTTWLTETIRVFKRYNLTIQHGLQAPHIWREEDKFLMQLISDLKCFGKTEMKQINEVRMHMRVMTVSDVITIDGISVRPEVLQGDRVESCSGNEYLWPNAAKPTSTTLRLWRQAIKRSLNLQDNTLRMRDI